MTMILIAPTDPFRVLRRQIRHLAPGVGQLGAHEHQQLPVPSHEGAE